MPRNPEICKRSRFKSVFGAKKARSLLVSTANRSARLLILSIIKETWVSKLKEDDKYFNIVSAKALLNHLADNCDSINNTDAVNIRLAMPSWWGESLGVPKFILWVVKY